MNQVVATTERMLRPMNLLPRRNRPAIRRGMLYTRYMVLILKFVKYPVSMDRPDTPPLRSLWGIRKRLKPAAMRTAPKMTARL
ncbi:hypothetical protein D3C73_1374570 [compost metagenome]